MALVDDILVRIGADITDLKDAVNSAASAIEEIASPISGLIDAFSGLGEAIVAAFAVEEIAKFVDEMIEVGTQALHMSEILGMTTEQVSALNFAAKALDLGNLSTSMQRLENNMVKAREGVAQYAAAYQALGVSLTTANGQEKSAEQVLGEVADAFKAMPDGMDKVNLAIAIGGRGFANMIPLLNEGKEGLDQYAEAAKRAGTAISEANAQDFEKMKLNATELGQSFVGLGQTLMEIFSPALNETMHLITNFIEGVNDAIKNDDLLRGSLQLLAGVFTALVAAVQTAVSAIEIVWNALASVIMSKIAEMIGALKALNAALHLDFTGMGAAWEAGFKNGEEITKKYTEKIKADMKEAGEAWKHVFDTGGPKPGEEKDKGPKTDQQLMTEGALLASQYDKQNEKLLILKTNIQSMTTDLAAAERVASQLRLDGASPEKIEAADKVIQHMKDSIADAGKQADKIEFEPVVKKSREAAEQVAADWTGSRTGLLQKQIATLNEYLAQVKGHADQEVEITREINEKKAALHRAEASEAKKGANEALKDYQASIKQQLEAAKGNYEEQIKIIDAAVQHMEQAGQTENSTYRSLKTEQVRIHKAAEDEKNKITAQSLQTRIQVMRIELQEQKIIDGDKVLTGEMTNRQMIQSELQKVDEIYRAEMQLLQQEQSLWAQGSQKWAEVQNKMTILTKQHELERQQIVHESIQKEIQDYQSFASKIGGLFSSTISGMLTQQQTFQKGMLNILNKIADEFASWIGKMIEKWILHELAKTASTATQSQIRNAINATESDSLIGLIFKALGEWIFGETAKTAAQTAGATTAVATATTEKMAYASEGATAAAASVAAIPIFGWAMAPEVFASTFALLSAPMAVGAWNVPANLMAPLHAGEMVVPQTFAEGLRTSGFGSNNNQGGGSNMNVSINVSAIDTQSGMAFIKSQAGTIANTIKQQMRNGTKFG